MNAGYIWNMFVAVAVLVLAVFSISIMRSGGKFRTLRRQAAEIYAERLRLARICPHCGYDVRAALKKESSGVCPECGRQVKPAH